MNKEIFDQLPADEQPVAAKLNSAADNMKVPQDFQWKLETQLMDAYQNKSQPAKGWFTKLIAPAAWTVRRCTRIRFAQLDDPLDHSVRTNAWLIKHSNPFGIFRVKCKTGKNLRGSARACA
jgi:hypothetical protein